ncbi:TNS2 protein, partial [Nothoprocta ornata]|nr:TNS2 protein [Nothoprocta pentlandii]NWY08446.1 TNS2 protein [Nothoprocta ornata]
VPRPPQVKCYHKQRGGAQRAGVFRVQFHTCTVHGAQLRFGKDELDEAWRGAGRARGWRGGHEPCARPHLPIAPPDERFPFEASVEFIFSSGPEKIKG